MTPEQRAALDKARGNPPGKEPDAPPPGASDDVVAGGGSSSSSGAPADPPDSGGGFFKETTRGLARGALSDIPIADQSEFVKGKGDESTLENAAYLGGKIAPFFVGLGEEALAAKLVAKGLDWAVSPGVVSNLVKAVGSSGAQKALTWLATHEPGIAKTVGSVARGARGGVMADPEHPVSGAATGALTGGAIGAMSPGVQAGVGQVAGAAPMLGAMAAGGGHSWPLFYALHHLSPALSALARATLGNPSVMGGAASEARKVYDTGEP